MKKYLDFMRYVRDNGAFKADRTGTGTYSVFGYQMRFDLSKGFPLVTTKKLHLKSIVHELIWFLQGSTNTDYLNDNGVTIWNEWADEEGNLGPIYGYQWRSWPTPDGGHIDQISQVLEQIKNNPDSRRLMVSAWNVADIPKMKLPPCHALFQFYVDDLTDLQRMAMWETKMGLIWQGGAQPYEWDKDGIPRKRLSCQLYQRSADIFLGVPFNIASYALLTHMMAQQAGMAVGDFVWTGGDCHLYMNHMDQVAEQLNRTPMGLPRLLIKRKPDTLFDYKFEDFQFLGYDPLPAIKAPVAV